MSGMEAYIPHSSKPWFNTACSRAIHDGGVAHKRQKIRPVSDYSLTHISPQFFFNILITVFLQLEIIKFYKSFLVLCNQCFILKHLPLSSLTEGIVDSVTRVVRWRQLKVARVHAAIGNNGFYR
ncbi:hypothetical protein E2C01_030874 [Portunus trituberculatus]|uniref:Uncharacterized protein n=1 Tax=Portunus trituberculatus TaxID=210409 RepID=A0A5B7EWK0_PORTR|nr:hypothetical protein [Portunus trituberculatus]